MPAKNPDLNDHALAQIRDVLKADITPSQRLDLDALVSRNRDAAGA